MKNQLWSKLFFGMLMLFAATSFTACVDDNDDTGVPYLELEAETLPFTLQGGDVTFTVETNRPWFITMGENSDWVTVAPMVGDGTTEVEISLPEATYGRVAELHFNLSNSYGVYMTKTLSVQQGEVAAIETIYKETCGTASVSSPWPYVDAYTSWMTEGTGADEVFYTGEKATIRSSGLANAGSGPNVVFFGAAPASFVVNKIALQPEQNRLNLSFLGSYSETLANNDYNNVFDLSQFEVAISGDGQKWSKLDIAKDNGDSERPYWVSAEADFSLVEVPDYLYIRFTANKASVFRVDDIELKTSNDLGPEIDLSQGTEGGATGGGDTPVTPAGDALWHENFGDQGEDKPLVKDYTNWEKGGSVGAAVTYDAPSGNVSVRESGKLSAGYAGASGAGKLFFGTNNPVFVVGNIALTSEQTKLKLNFGGAYAKSNNDTYDNTFYAEKFHVALSGDGATWSEINYTTAKADEFWVYATADVTLKAAPSKLYVKFWVDEVSVFAIDDVQLSLGEGGQSVDLATGDTGGDEPSDPVVTDAVWYESFGVPVKGSNGYWPYANENTANVMSGSGVVAGTTSYAGYNTSARTVASQNSPNPPCSGEGHVWFPANKTADKNFFTVEKLALKGQTNLDLAFYLYGNSAVYKTGDVVLDFSGDGEKWVTVNFTTGAVSGATTEWVKATASVTLKNAIDYLYIRFSSATTGGVRMDDPTLTVGKGGTQIDLGEGSGGGEEPTPTPTPGEDTSLDFTDAGSYMLVWSVGGKMKAALPASNYNLLVKDVAVENNTIVAAGNEAAVWRVAASSVEGQYTIQGSDNKYYAMKGDFDAFNKADDLTNSELSYEWVFRKQSDGRYMVLNVHKQKWMQWDETFSNITASKQTGAMPYIFKANADGSAYELIGGGSTPDSGEEPTPEPEPDPTPSGVLSVKELVQLMIAGTPYTDKTVEGYVAAYGGSGTENVSQGTVVLTDNDGAEYSGLTVYKYDLSSLGLKVGDKIQIKLTNATTGDYNGLRQLATVANDDVTVISSGATINYKTLTGAQLNADYAKYLSVPVQVANATPTAASVGKTFASSLTFNDGTDFTVYNRSKWAAGAELTVHNVTATVRGVVSVYNSTPQLVPTSTADVEAFTQGGTTPDPDPTPDPTPDPDPTPGEGGGRDDFSTLTNSNQYGAQQTTAGWVGANCAVQSGGSNDSNPVFKSLLGSDSSVKGMVINGKTSAVGSITSPKLTGGCGTLSLNYGYAFSESNGVDFKVEILQGGVVVQSYQVKDASIAKLAAGQWSQAVNVAGEFQIVITNNHPTNNASSNKDRYTIWNISWTGKAN
ncbi:MAG: hypothetical protein E7149_03615 [Rikenellaceae bacterium]|nr:hypothetical protein [Rikenellaceae bacterium]